MTLTTHIAISGVLLALTAVYFIKRKRRIEKNQKNYSDFDKIWAWQETYIETCMAAVSILFSTLCFLALIYEYLTK